MSDDIRRSPSEPASGGKRFRVAFSFAGERRDFVAKAATILAERFGQERILYDKYHEAEFARNDLGIYLPNLYNRQSDLLVVVVCPKYDVKEWTGLEWLAIHHLLQQRRREEVMLGRFDYAQVDGLFGGAGFIELNHKTPEQFADLILERLAINEGQPRDHYKTGGSGIAGATRGGAVHPAPGRSPAPSRNDAAIEMWRKRRAFLEIELAKSASAPQRFEIQCGIDEAQKKIAELGGDA